MSDKLFDFPLTISDMTNDELKQFYTELVRDGQSYHGGSLMDYVKTMGAIFTDAHRRIALEWLTKDLR